VIVTGHTGFIGQHLVRHSQELEIIGISRSASREGPVKSIRLDLAYLEKSMPERDTGLRGTYAVIHLSAYRPLVGTDRRDSLDENMRANVGGTLTALSMARMLGANRFLLASTKSVYRESTVPVTEADPTAPVTNYGKSKLLAERLCETFAEGSPMKCTALRISSVFGSGMPFGLVFAAFLNKAVRNETIEVRRHKSGFEYLDLIYINDVVEAIRKALLTKQEKPFDIINIGSGSGISTFRLAETIVEGTGSHSQIKVTRTNDTRIGTVLNVEKASEVLRWSPSYDVRSAIRDLLPSWHSKNAVDEHTEEFGL
jgi:nucleoside-diphosphate-sugar epimerase